MSEYYPLYILAIVLFSPVFILVGMIIYIKIREFLIWLWGNLILQYMYFKYGRDKFEEENDD